MSRHQGTILITGGAKRIGRAIALALFQAGYAIALHYHSSTSEAKSLQKKIRRAKGRLRLFECDLSSEAATLKLIPRVKKACPDLMGLINNASVYAPSKLATSSMACFQENMKVNFHAPYILTKQFARACKKGVIINILDTNIFRHTSIHADYLLSKKALAQLSAMSALELAPRIRVNAIAPGLILPPAGETQSYLRQRAKNIPLKRTGSPQNIAQAALFLLENDFVAGETLFVDGGEHLL